MAASVNTSAADAIPANGDNVVVAIHIASGGESTHAGSTSPNVTRALQVCTSIAMHQNGMKGSLAQAAAARVLSKNVEHYNVLSLACISKKAAAVSTADCFARNNCQKAVYCRIMWGGTM